jgi:multidrug efflux pump subunit AcrA (membrane-fusion protein)
MTPSTAPVMSGQTRLVWVLGQDEKPQPRRITVGLSDGSATEVVSGNLQEGDVIIIGETVSGQSATQSQTTRVPGFGGGQRGGFGGARR